jgi:molybdopterin molybdotransferase
LSATSEVVKGQNIRRTGEELKKGDLVFDVGQKITPAAVGTLSSLGLSKVLVFDQPIIHIVTTGNELVVPGLVLREGQIYESNGATLQSALNQYGFACHSRSQIKDDFDAIKLGIGKALEKVDVILISGGISVGDYDFVKKALEENGVKELFYKVAQKPGKPLFFGRKEGVFVFALPGNPASALTCFYMYVLPLIQKLKGETNPGLLKLNLPLAHEYEMKSDRPTFFKANISEGKVSLMHGQGSSMLHSLALGNALVFLEIQKSYALGEMVETYIL